MRSNHLVWEDIMTLEIFLWGWVHFHPVHSLKRGGRLLLIAAIILLPLLYMNVSLARQGFKISAPSFNLQVAHSSASSGNLDYNLDE
jgi:hypothetical protein